VYSSPQVADTVLEQCCDVVAVLQQQHAPATTDGGWQPFEGGRDWQRQHQQQEQQQQQQEGEGEGQAAGGGARDTALEGDADPGVPLQPSRIVSHLAGGLAPQLLQGAGGGDGGGGDSGATCSGGWGATPAAVGLQLWRLRIGLTRGTFEQAVGGPQDPARRPWQKAFLAVAAWLAPHWGVAAAAGGCSSCGGGDDECGSGGGGDPPAETAAAQAGNPHPASTLLSAASRDATEKAVQADREEDPCDFDASMLYGWAKPTGLEPRVADAEVPPALLPKLRPYQARAVWWMLARERAPTHPVGLVASLGIGSDGNGSESDGSTSDVDGVATREPLHPLWRRVHALPGGFARTFYLNPFSGLISSRRYSAPPPVRGGCSHFWAAW
jgi:hypothetical protein